jgi:ATP-dependent protease ClpP protease subunit
MNNECRKNLFLIGDIEDKLLKETLINLWDDINIIEKKVKLLNIFIQTDGGDLHSCFALLDAIEYLKEQTGFKINTFGIGKVVSAGFFLFLLGDYRVLFPSTRMYVHEHLVIGDECSPFSERIKSLEEDKAVYDIYLNYTKRRLGIGEKRVKALLKKNKWLTRKEIIKYNIIKDDNV